jgi:hypothetical protein
MTSREISRRVQLLRQLEGRKGERRVGVIEEEGGRPGSIDFVVVDKLG